MFKMSQLVEFAKSASQESLNHDKSLNTIISEKLAGQKFTDEELNRIVEMSNTQTYIELRKTAENRYVNFEVADSNKIKDILKVASPVSEVQILSPHSDYSAPPSSPPPLEKAASVQSFVKTAEMFIAEDAPAFTKDLNGLKDNILTNSMEVDGRVNKLANNVRQLMLEGARPDDVKNLFTLVDREGVVWNQVSSKLTEEFPAIKTAEVDTKKMVNPDHPIVKEIYDLTVKIGEIIEKSAAYDTINFVFEKIAEEYKESALKPVVKLTGAGIAGLGLFGLGQASAESKRILKNNIDKIKVKGALS